MEEFKLIVAGGRDFNNEELFVASLLDIAEYVLDDYAVSIVSGMAEGADLMAYNFCMEQEVKCYEFPADWKQYGKSAGYRRNEVMAKFADGLLAFWDGKSKGTMHTILTMEALGKPVQVIKY